MNIAVTICAHRLLATRCGRVETKYSFMSYCCMVSIVRTKSHYTVYSNTKSVYTRAKTSKPRTGSQVTLWDLLG